MRNWVVLGVWIVVQGCTGAENLAQSSGPDTSLQVPDSVGGVSDGTGTPNDALQPPEATSRLEDTLLAPDGFDGSLLDGEDADIQVSDTGIFPLEPIDVDTAESDGALPDSGGPLVDTTPVEADVFLSDVSEVEPDAEPFVCPACVPSPAAAEYIFPPEGLGSVPVRTRNNPLKGMMTSYLWGPPANDFPDQLEFVYLPMKDVWGPEGPTLETGFEPLLQAAAERGHQLVMRVYVDYPTKPYGLPPHLEGDVPCQPYTDHGGGCSPDYDHPALVEAMVGLLSALGTTYDGDPRLAVVQVGLLGHWGEWHTWPHPEWFPSAETQAALLHAADDAFAITQVQLRKPAVHSPQAAVGYHDDSFAHSTLGDVEWFFWNQVLAAGDGDKWKSHMMGGELRPELQSLCFQEDYTLGLNAQDPLECIGTTHASYLLNYKAFNEEGTGYVGVERENAESAALSMGYQFELTGAKLTLSGMHEGQVNTTLTVDVTQTGVAPFYYDLFVSIRRPNGDVLATHETSLKGLLPGQTQTLVFELGMLPIVPEPFDVHLSSPMLLPGQTVLMATKTSSTGEGSPTRLQWSPVCQEGDFYAPLGEPFGETEEGCPCLCDVDGLPRSCDGTVCL